jgi:hypothetical protein
VLDVGKNLMGSEDNLGKIRRLANVIGQGFRDFPITHGALVKDPNRRRVYPRRHFLSDRPVDQFPGRLKDDNPLSGTSEFTGSVDDLIGFAGSAGSGGVFDTH